VATIANPLPPVHPASSESQAFRNLLNMCRCHGDLERRAQQEHKPKIELPAEDTHRSIQFGEPKKNPP